MICDSCENCKSFRMEAGGYKVSCGKRGPVVVHGDFAEMFSCDSYAEIVQKEEPVKDNVMVVLKGSGRDFIFTLPEIHSKGELINYLNSFVGDIVEIGDFCFYRSEIAAFAYIGNVYRA